MPTVFEVLAEPNRRTILDLLRDEDRSVNELVAALPLTQPTVSKHLKVLRDTGLVTARADAHHRIYRLQAAPLREAADWLERYRRFWDTSFDRLDAHLAAIQAQDDDR